MKKEKKIRATHSLKSAGKRQVNTVRGSKQARCTHMLEKKWEKQVRTRKESEGVRDQGIEGHSLTGEHKGGHKSGSKRKKAMGTHPLVCAEASQNSERE